MSDFYVFNMLSRDGYTREVFPRAEQVAAYEDEPDCVVFNDARKALAWMNRCQHRFEDQAYLEYRSYLEESIEVEEREAKPSPEAEQAETEPAAPVRTPQAAAVMCEALETAAGQTLADLFRKTSACPKSSAELLATVERIESYRLALSVVAAAWAKAERAAQEG